MLKAIVKLFSPKKAKPEQTKAAIEELEKLMSLKGNSSQKSVKFANVDLNTGDQSSIKSVTSVTIPPR